MQGNGSGSPCFGGIVENLQAVGLLCRVIEKNNGKQRTRPPKKKDPRRPQKRVKCCTPETGLHVEKFLTGTPRKQRGSRNLVETKKRPPSAKEKGPF